MSKKAKSLLTYCISESIIIVCTFLITAFILGDSIIFAIKCSILLAIMVLAIGIPAYLKGYDEGHEENINE